MYVCTCMCICMCMCMCMCRCMRTCMWPFLFFWLRAKGSEPPSLLGPKRKLVSFLVCCFILLAGWCSTLPHPGWKALCFVCLETAHVSKHREPHAPPCARALFKLFDSSENCLAFIPTSARKSETKKEVPLRQKPTGRQHTQRGSQQEDNARTEEANTRKEET